mmetsp:Transcript_2770/g.7797  ORF Transcript_2770/g.7797 Transcript_2770/m.7797 type:complete len:244 (-) Transcript_2770:644-1375(-)
MSMTCFSASFMLAPPSTRPKDKTLNHCQCKSFTVRKRCRRDIDAFPTHSTSSESQCSSFSGRFEQTMYLSWYAPKWTCSLSMPGCFIWPDATRANTLKGWALVVSRFVASSTKPDRRSSALKVPVPPNSSISSRRASRKDAEFFKTGTRPVSSAFTDVAPSVPAKKKGLEVVLRHEELRVPASGDGAERSMERSLAASSRRTLSTASRGQFLKDWKPKPGPSSDMSTTWTKRELTLLCPKILT